MYFCKTLRTKEKQIMSLAEILEFKKGGGKTLFEWLDGTQVYKPYVDMDEEICDQSYTLKDIETKTNETIELGCYKLRCLFDEPNLKFAIESSSGFEDKIKKGITYNIKISVHIVVLGLKIQGQYFKDLIIENKYDDIFDLSVYNPDNQKFRVASFKKKGSPRESVIHSGELSDFLISNITDEEHIEGVGSNMKPIITTIDPVIENPQVESPTIIYSDYDEVKVKTLLDMITPSNYEEWIQTTKILKSINPKLKDIWTEWSIKQDGYNEDENNKIWDNIKSTGYKIASLHFMARKNKKAYQQMKLKSFIDDVLFSPTQSSIADLFVEIISGRVIITDTKHGDAYVFNEDNCLWEERRLSLFYNYISKKITPIFYDVMKDNNDTIKVSKDEEAIDKLKATNKKCMAIIKDLQNASFLGGCIKFIVSHNGIYRPDFRDILIKNRHLLGVKNGVVNLKTGELRNREPEDYLVSALDVDYNTNASSQVWEDFLYDIMEHPNIKDTPAVVAYIKKLFGYCITRETKEQIMVLMNGCGGNGKSLLLNTITNIFKPVCASVDESLFDGNIKKQSANAASPATADLFNKAMGLVTEIDENTSFDKVFKQIVDGGTLSGRQLHSAIITFENTIKIMAVTNHIPKFTCDAAILRRINCLTFHNTYVPQEKLKKGLKLRDNDLEDKLLENKEGILKWFIEGSVIYYNERLDNVPEDLIVAKQMVVEMNDWTASIQLTTDKNDKMTINDIKEHINIACGNTQVSPKLVKKLLEEMGAIQYRTSMERGYRYIKSKLLVDIEKHNYDDDADN